MLYPDNEFHEQFSQFREKVKWLDTKGEGIKKSMWLFLAVLVVLNFFEYKVDES